MIDVKDRVPTRPNRIKLTDESTGVVKYYVWERADEPTVAGTPINKALFDSMLPVVSVISLASTAWSVNNDQTLTVAGYDTNKKILIPYPTSKSDMDEYVRCGIRFEDVSGTTVKAVCYLAKPTKNISVTLEMRDKAWQ